jgi:hypothetical protein
VGFLGGLCGGTARQKGEGPLWESLIGEEFKLTFREHVGREIVHVGGLEVRYRSIASDFHRPINWTNRGSTWAHRSAMAPPARSAWAEISPGCKPSSGI